MEGPCDRGMVRSIQFAVPFSNRRSNFWERRGSFGGIQAGEFIRSPMTCINLNCSDSAV